MPGSFSWGHDECRATDTLSGSSNKEIGEQMQAQNAGAPAK